MITLQRSRVSPEVILRWATLGMTLAVVLLAPMASGFDAVEDVSSPDPQEMAKLAQLAQLSPRIVGRRSISDGDDAIFFKAAKSLPRIGKRVNNNEIFPGVRRLLKPLPRVGRSSHDGDDNFLLKGMHTSDVFKAVDDMKPHQVVRRAGTSDQQQTLLEADFLKGFKALPRIGRRDGPSDASAEDSETHHGDKRAPLTGSWSNSELPWFRQQDGPAYPSKKSGLSDLVRLSGLRWEEAAMKEKPQESPFAVVTLADDRDTPDAWHYNIFGDTDHRLE